MVCIDARAKNACKLVARDAVVSTLSASQAELSSATGALHARHVVRCQEARLAAGYWAINHDLITLRLPYVHAELQELVPQCRASGSTFNLYHRDSHSATRHWTHEFFVRYLCIRDLGLKIRIKADPTKAMLAIKRSSNVERLLIQANWTFELRDRLWHCVLLRWRCRGGGGGRRR